MHTVSMPVKSRAKSVKSGTSRVAQGAATRASLVDAARKVFGARGFADTSLDEVVAEARVTKGALYHHFRGKEDLFAAVYEQVQREVSDNVVTEFLRPDPWEALQLGCELGSMRIWTLQCSELRCVTLDPHSDGKRSVKWRRSTAPCPFVESCEERFEQGSSTPFRSARSHLCSWAHWARPASMSLTPTIERPLVKNRSP